MAWPVRKRLCKCRPSYLARLGFSIAAQGRSQHKNSSQVFQHAITQLQTSMQCNVSHMDLKLRHDVMKDAYIKTQQLAASS